MLSNNWLISTRSYTVRVTTFSTGGKFQLVSTFTELHILTQVVRFYVLLCTQCHMLQMHFAIAIYINMALS